MQFFRIRAKKIEKGKRGQNVWKFGQKFTKCENILKKGRCLHAIITFNKLLEKALRVGDVNYILLLYLKNYTNDNQILGAGSFYSIE